MKGKDTRPYRGYPPATRPDHNTENSVPDKSSRWAKSAHIDVLKFFELNLNIIEFTSTKKEQNIASKADFYRFFYMYEFALFLRLTRPAVKKEDRLKFILSDLRARFPPLSRVWSGPSPRDFGEARGLLSRTAAGNRAYSDLDYPYTFLKVLV